MLFIILAIILIFLGFIVFKKKGFGITTVIIGLLIIPINIFLSLILIILGMLLIGVC